MTYDKNGVGFWGTFFKKIAKSLFQQCPKKVTKNLKNEKKIQGRFVVLITTNMHKKCHFFWRVFVISHEWSRMLKMTLTFMDTFFVNIFVKTSGFDPLLLITNRSKNDLKMTKNGSFLATF